MPKVIINNIFRVLAIFTLGSLFLSIVFKNLPFPLHAPTFYLALWLVLLLLFDPAIYINKLLLGIYLLVLILSLGSMTIWRDMVVGWGESISFIYVYGETVWVFLAIIMYLYFMRARDYYGYAIVTAFALGFIVITSITTIIGLELFPSASRNMAMGTAAIDLDFHIIYHKIGIATYGFFAGVAFIMPCVAYHIKGQKSVLKKITYLCLVLLVIYALNKAEHTTILLAAVILFLIGYLKPQKSFLTYCLIIFVFIIFLVFPGVIANSLYFISDTQNESEVNSRLRDLGDTIEFQDYDPATSATYTSAERLGRSLFSLVAFLNNPLIGSGLSSGHAFWLDRLALFGLLGFFPWVIIYYKSIKYNSRFFNKEYSKYYIISVFASIAFGCLKGMGGPEIWVAFFFIMPGIYFLSIYNGPRNLDSMISYTWEQKKGGSSGEFTEETHPIVQGKSSVGGNPGTEDFGGVGQYVSGSSKPDTELENRGDQRVGRSVR